MGRFVSPDHEAVRFAVEPSTCISAKQYRQDPVGWCKATGAGHVYGTYRSRRCAARCYSAFLLSRIRERDHTLVDFLDLFNHRMISLFYRAWEKYRFGVTYERDGVDRVSKYLIGWSAWYMGLEKQLGCRRAAALLYRTPRASARSAVALGSYWRTTSTCRSKWSSLSVSGATGSGDQCVFDDGDSFSEQLGVAAVVGDAIWDRQSRIRLKLAL